MVPLVVFKGSQEEADPPTLELGQALKQVQTPTSAYEKGKSSKDLWSRP
jgi:hypothetical protein